MPDLGLPTDLTTALTVLVIGVVIPVVTAILTDPRTPGRVRRAIPIILAAVGALLVLFLRGDLDTLPQSLAAWITLAAVLVGVAQTIYAVMPAQWRALAAATSAGTGRHADRDGVMDGRDTPTDAAPAPAPDVRATHAPVDEA